MTLITNYFNHELIIIASDKRRTKISDIAKKMVAQDNATKLLHSTKYVIGLNGTLITEKNNLQQKINQLVLNNENINPQYFIEIFKKEIVPLVEEGKELNITVSGAYKNELVSYYYESQEDILTDCIKEDKENIRFNGDNSKAGQYFGQSFIFIREYLRLNKLIELTEIKRPELNNYSMEIIVDSFKWMYQRYHENNIHYANIGGKMDCCIIHKDGKIEEFLNM